MSPRIGSVTLLCRALGSSLVAGPWLYLRFVPEGSAYHFLALLLLGLVAGVVLMANSLVCLLLYRNWKSAGISAGFLLVGVIGVLTARHFLPQFRM